ncbi:hypothetical protein [Planococcus dechangensis]|uniref:DUF5590 domain-containing protein n=1 Tax=Planococcus dechangensis TaxID=1176255 RepID=A0ABV9MC66_9BACL
MKKYQTGIIISIAILALLLFINSQIYSNVMPLSVVIPLLTVHVFFFYALQEKQRYKTYAAFVVVFAVALFVSLPNYTQQQALELATAEYPMDVSEMSNVSVTGSSEWNPLSLNWTYVFRGDLDGEVISVMVVADSGKVFKIQE